ncbi:kunitz-type U19-barytoxin-Tl1a [Caerostris darwini]|uniref:Kunitz-type U19-barytoxin-Tl1a n=1 Tax=Caerostris darwini TaxID=1538125 RepID=A0AAV4WPX3_9ARAC|nr:kunitz-type U19-barytoxin-Tl1a [Caerostris darwini]
MKVIIGFVLLAGVFGRQESCPENEHFESCGTDCPITCENYSNPPEICNEMCVAKCFCDDGFVRREEDGKCVRPLDCPNRDNHQCPENEHYDRCGTDCPVTCENFFERPEECNKMCVSKCFCDEDYVRRRDGKCVRPIDCFNYGNPERNCVDHPDTGLCRALFYKFYYDEETKSCHEFVYGGCGGNGNKFNSEKECLEHCRGELPAEEVNCNADADAGPCRAFMRRYFFNQSEGTCQKFYYGGCQGNTNNFETKAECRNACGGNH